MFSCSWEPGFLGLPEQLNSILSKEAKSFSERTIVDKKWPQIFEVDYIGKLRYEGKSEPALKALDRMVVVIYAGIFTKMLIPGFRVGYLVAHELIFKRLVAAKYIKDLSTFEILQRFLTEYISVGRYHVQLKNVTNAYFRRRKAVKFLSEHLQDA